MKFSMKISAQLYEAVETLGFESTHRGLDARMMKLRAGEGTLQEGTALRPYLRIGDITMGPQCEIHCDVDLATRYPELERLNYGPIPAPTAGPSLDDLMDGFTEDKSASLIHIVACFQDGTELQLLFSATALWKEVGAILQSANSESAWVGDEGAFMSGLTLPGHETV